MRKRSSICQLCTQKTSEPPSTFNNDTRDLIKKLLDIDIVSSPCLKCSTKVGEIQSFIVACKTAQLQKSSRPKPIWLCSDCQHSFASRHLLRLHRKTCPLKGVVRFGQTFTCECGKTLRTKAALRAHRVVHKDRPKAPKDPVVCSTCGKSFSHTGSLTVHQAFHEQRKDFECNFCHRRFYRKALLADHLHSHSGIRKFVCSFCRRAFFTRKQLHKHEALLHKKEKLLGCPICTKRFFYQHKLKAHMRTHAKTREEVRCLICDASGFKSEKELKRHMELRHPVPPLLPPPPLPPPPPLEPSLIDEPSAGPLFLTDDDQQNVPILHEKGESYLQNMEPNWYQPETGIYYDYDL